MSYIGISPEFWNLNVNKYSYTATAAQTTFNAAYDTVVDVYLNGSKLASTDYTATDGMTVVLSSPATLGDIIDIAGYFNMEVFATNNFIPFAVSKTSDTGAAIIPSGPTSDRPVGAFKYFRYNETLNGWEGYNGTTWSGVGGGATGGGTDHVFYENDTTVNSNYTVTTGKNAVTAGPVVVNAVVTVPANSVWTVV
jgi:hypothetical protein